MPQTARPPARSWRRARLEIAGCPPRRRPPAGRSWPGLVAGAARAIFTLLSTANASALRPGRRTCLELVVRRPGFGRRAARCRPDHRPNLLLVEDLAAGRTEDDPDNAAAQSHRRTGRGDVLVVRVVATELDRTESRKLSAGRRIENRDEVAGSVLVDSH